MSSAAERHLRELVVDRLRVVAPDARIVHELNVDTGRCRVDVAAILPNRLLFVEIKSRKDKLDRLPEQTRIFGPACHRLAVCYASERWDYMTVHKATEWTADLWPEDKAARWSFTSWERHPPCSAKMLNLLWRDELFAEAQRAGLQPHGRDSRLPLISRMWRALNGSQIEEAVCRQLRARPFAEGDAPIYELAVAA